MSNRSMPEIQAEYGRTAAEVGDLQFKKGLSEEEVEKLEYQIRKRLDKMNSLAQEAKKLAELAPVPAPVIEEPKDESK